MDVMRRLIFSTFALATMGAAEPTFIPQRLYCLESGAWSCNREPDGICIGGLRKKRGPRYTFNFAKMTFKHPLGEGRIISITESSIGAFNVRLSNETQFEYDPRHTTRWGHIIVTLAPVSLPEQSYSMPGLWCRL